MLKRTFYLAAAFTITMFIASPASGQNARPDEQRKSDITWETNATQFRGQDGIHFALVCPANGMASTKLWGDSVYTDDSSICTAAVHSGRITIVAGGTVTIEILPGMGAYGSSTKHGITSKRYGSFEGSFAFVN